jgi:CBS domain-containing protein
VVARASSVMTSGVITVPPHAPLERARVLLVGNRFSALPVVDGQDRLVGIVTTLDLLRAEVEGRANARVGEVMTRDPMTAAPETALTIIAHRLRHYGGKRVMPIVDRGFLVGIVTRGDLLRPPDERSFLSRILGSGSADDDFDEPPDAPRIGTTAGEVMTPLADVYYAEPTSTLEYAATTLSRYRLTALPVLDEENRLLGVVSEADLVPDRLSGRRGPYTYVEDVMTAGGSAVMHTFPVVKVARVMIKDHRRVLPVLDDDRRVIGMISRGDLLRADSPPAPKAVET